jgi:hypothetical protein
MSESASRRYISGKATNHKPLPAACRAPGEGTGPVSALAHPYKKVNLSTAFKPLK